MHPVWLLFYFTALINAACPYMDGSSELTERAPSIHARDGGVGTEAEKDFLEQFTVDDTDSFLTSDAGGPIQDSASLKAGERGPTLLEDFLFRQKITHFDHERVCAAINCLYTAEK